MWVVSSENLNSVLELNQSIYLLNVNQSIILNKYKTNFKYNKQYQKLKIQNLRNGYIYLDVKETVNTLILLNQSKQLEVPLNNNKLNLEYLKETLNNQVFKVYAIIDQEIYPILFNETQITIYLIMKYEWINNYLKVSFNDISANNLSVTSLNNESILRISAYLESEHIKEAYEFKSLGLIDTDLNNIKYLDTKKHGSQINSIVDLKNFENTKNKKIIAIFEEKNKNKEILFSINNKNKLKFSGYYYIENQIYNFSIKKKNNVTVINSKPKIKMGVNSITEETLSIYFLPNSIYYPFQYYITFEERSSTNRFEIPIGIGEVDIEIPYDKIESLKTISKNIIDVFISIYDGTNIIRKEKIKFKKGIYKKDNYITLKEKTLNNKKVFYMFTLTPFKNIKIESFELTLENYTILKNGQKSNDVWLIGERSDTAQDNGIQLFKWLQQNTDKEAYYVIDRESSDYKNVEHLDNIITFGSEQHFEIAARANVLISTHDLENLLPYKTAKNFWDYESSIRIFLQHGVLGRKKVEYDKENYELPFHLFNVSSTNEKYDIVVDQLGYNPKDVAITGLPRFDNLPLYPKQKTKKILIMPTWRDWLNSDYAFEHSEYMNRYINLINHPMFEEIIRKYNIEVNFYPHYRAQSFFKYHLDKTNGLINYIQLGEQTVQDLLIEHDILITDYSSVSFDFSYMKKPVIFFHFDVERFFKKGIFRPIEETFVGDIVYNEHEILNRIENIIKFQSIQSYTDLSHIFDFVDHKNNERVYHEILNKIKSHK